MSKGFKHSIIAYLSIILVWKILSTATNPLILPPPERVVLALIDILLMDRIFDILSGTFKRAVLGLGTAVFVGTVMGVLLSPFTSYIRPAITALQNIPLVSWILLAIIWFGFTDMNVVFVVFLSTLPVIYLNTVAGMKNIDQQYLEMLESFSVPVLLKWYAAALPTIAAHVSSGISIAIAIMWKSAVMIELLVSRPGIGTELGISRTYLMTDRLIAWTVLLVILGISTEALWSFFARRKIVKNIYRSWFPIVTFLSTNKQVPIQHDAHLIIEKVSKTYTHNGEGQVLFKDLSLTLAAGDRIAIQGPSGVGKTTLLNMIAGTSKPDTGRVLVSGKRPGYMFQDARLLPWLTAEENIVLILVQRLPFAKARKEAVKMLTKLAIPSSRYPDQLSGGMKQVVSLARALSSEGGLYLLDEPFRSSDVGQKQRMKQLIDERVSPTDIMIFVSHQKEDVLPYIDAVYVLDGEPAMLKKE